MESTWILCGSAWNVWGTVKYSDFPGHWKQNQEESTTKMGYRGEQLCQIEAHCVCQNGDGSEQRQIS